MNSTQILTELLVESLAAVNESPRILTDCTGDPEYEKYRLVFNRKFRFRPTVIVFVENTEQVSVIMKLANKHPDKVILRLRSGGHDHEGECSGTDTLLMDFTEMNGVEILEKTDNGPRTPIAVQPGARFQVIKKFLDKNDLGIPHGTCETVAIAGFTMGGGWGPWTRKYGMACESLTGATIVLGNGDVRNLSETDPPDSREGKLLWALRGGGGMSYGVVTKLFFNAFTLPEIAFSFNIKINQPFKLPNASEEKWHDGIYMPAIKVLKLWENAIAPGKYPQLIGTNLKIEAAHLEAGKPDPEAQLKCQFNGYFGGTLEQLKTAVREILGEKVLEALTARQDRMLLDGVPKNADGQYTWRFESWDRQRTRVVRNANGDGYHKIQLEDDGPAPHKITSRLVDAEGWNDDGRKALICSLQSPKVPPESDALLDHGVHCYFTLGAISGGFYEKYDPAAHNIGSSFPYKKRPFTIQYQCWWDQFMTGENEFVDNKLVPQGLKDLTKEEKQELILNRHYVNRAQDWIEDARDYDIPNTSGAFISFKDSSVPTSTYFMQSYKDLMTIKLEESEDQNLLLRTRKTII